ncbi:hypothetical protein [Vreelandella sp. EE22]
MVNRLWIPLLASLALLLSACGESQEDPTVELDETERSVSDDEAVQGEEAPQAAENAANMPAPDEVEDEVESRQAAEEIERAEALDEGGSAGAQQQPMAGEEVQADEETLAADPEDALDEQSAMPGETTRSDVDDVIAETERRFEEAQRQLEQQFQEVESQTTELEPTESANFTEDWEVESSLPESTRRENDPDALDVDALIEDTERRFEAAQERLNQQFEELERERDSSVTDTAVNTDDQDAPTGSSEFNAGTTSDNTGSDDTGSENAGSENTGPDGTDVRETRSGIQGLSDGSNGEAEVLETESDINAEDTDVNGESNGAQAGETGTPSSSADERDLDSLNATQ